MQRKPTWLETLAIEHDKSVARQTEEERRRALFDQQVKGATIEETMRNVWDALHAPFPPSAFPLSHQHLLRSIDAARVPQPETAPQLPTPTGVGRPAARALTVHELGLLGMGPLAAPVLESGQPTQFELEKEAIGRLIEDYVKRLGRPPL